MKFISLLISALRKSMGATDSAEIKKLQDQLLSALLYGMTTLGLVLYYLNVRVSFLRQDWGYVAGYTIVYVWIIIITFYRKIPYRVRAGSVTVLFYLLGTSMAILRGSVGDGRTWMIGFSIFTSIFLGTRLGILSSLFGGLTLISVGWAENQKIFTSNALFQAPMSNWVLTSITATALSLVTNAAIGYLLANLSERLAKERDITNELSNEREELRKRTTDLERRQRQLRTASEIAQTIATELDPQAVFQRTVDLLTDRFGLYYAGVFLVDEEKRYAKLSAGSGEAGQAMLAEGHQLIIGGSSMIGWTIANKQPRIALDVGREAVRFDNPHLPRTRSELALPMISRGRVLGALSIQSAEAEAFDNDDISILQTIADSLATASENTQLLLQSQTNLEEIQTLHRQYLRQAWESFTQDSSDLEYVFEGESSLETAEELSTIEAPLILRGQQIGNIVIETENPKLTAEEKSMLDAITTQAALALENARLIEETQRRSRRDRIVSDITGKVQRSTNVDEALKTMLRELGQTLGASEGRIHLEVRE